MHRLIVVVMVVLGVSVGGATAQGTISVVGTGEAAAPPDMATIRLGVASEADEAAEAMRANAASMKRVLARLADAGIDARDIQTSDLSLSPRWSRPEPGRDAEVTGFVASNTLVVRVRDLDVLGPTLDAALGDGVNTLGGLRFGFADAAELRDAARRAAVADAKRAAEVLAAAAGVTLGELQELSELGGTDGPQPMARMEMAVADAAPVAAGEATIRASVRMVFAVDD